jgi:hypothetical protein
MHDAPRKSNARGRGCNHSMSHHFNTALAARDPRLNVADAYLFDAAAERTVMVMMCNADAGLSAPATFHAAAL